MTSPDQTPSSNQQASFKVSIVDPNKNRFIKLTRLLESQKLKVSFHSGAGIEKNFVEEIKKDQPDIVVINLFLEGKSALNRIKAIKTDIPSAKIIVLTAHNSITNIRESVKAGADDFLLDPFEPQLMLDRIRYQLQDREMFNPESLDEAKAPAADANDAPKLAASQKNVDLIYESLRNLSEITNHHEAITTVLEAIGENANSTRVNLIEGDLESNKGLVTATSDDKTLADLEIDLEKYPEVREVLLNGNIIYIKDITQNPLTKDIQEQVKSIKITSLLVFPIRHRSNTLGSLNIRLAGGDSVSERQLKTYFIIALALGPKLAAKRLLRRHKQAKEQQPQENTTATPNNDNFLDEDTPVATPEAAEESLEEVLKKAENEADEAVGNMSEDASEKEEPSIDSKAIDSGTIDSGTIDSGAIDSGDIETPPEAEATSATKTKEDVTIDDLLQAVEDENK